MREFEPQRGNPLIVSNEVCDSLGHPLVAEGNGIARVGAYTRRQSVRSEVAGTAPIVAARNANREDFLVGMDDRTGSVVRTGSSELSASIGRRAGGPS
jgi:hypothetical protein